LEHVRKSATVIERAYSRFVLDQVVANKSKVFRCGRSDDMSLWVSIKSQDVSANYFPNSLLEIIQMVKVLGKVILVEDMRPIFILNLFEEVRAEHDVQTHDLDESGDFGPLNIAFPPFAVRGIESLRGNKKRCGHSFPP